MVKEREGRRGTESDGSWIGGKGGSAALLLRSLPAHAWSSGLWLVPLAFFFTSVQQIMRGARAVGRRRSTCTITFAMASLTLVRFHLCFEAMIQVAAFLSTCLFLILCLGQGRRKVGRGEEQENFLVIVCVNGSLVRQSKKEGWSKGGNAIEEHFFVDGEKGIKTGRWAEGIERQEEENKIRPDSGEMEQEG